MAVSPVRKIRGISIFARFADALDESVPQKHTARDGRSAKKRKKNRVDKLKLRAPADEYVCILNLVMMPTTMKTYYSPRHLSLKLWAYVSIQLQYQNYLSWK